MRERIRVVLLDYLCACEWVCCCQSQCQSLIICCRTLSTSVCECVLVVKVTEYLGGCIVGHAAPVLFREMRHAIFLLLLSSF